MSEDDVTTELSQDETQLLLKISRWVEGVTIFSIAWNLFMGWFMLWRHGQFRWTPLLSVLSLVVAWPLLRHSRRVLLAQGFEPHLLVVSLVSWMVALSLVVGAPDAFPIAALVATMPVMVGLMASRRFLKRLMLGSMAVFALVAVISAFLPAEQFMQMSHQGVRRIHAVFVPMTLLMVFGALWASSTRLRNTVRDMLNANRALAESERSLERKVEERTAALKQSERELALARDAALDASRTKSSFLANMSHELRTPLNAIIGYSEMLQDEAREAGQQDFIPDLEKILSSGRYLLTLINGVLDLSKIEAGKMDLFLETFDVGELVDGVTATIQPLIQKNANALQIADTATLGTMHSDITKLRQVLFNLLSNASKFTEGGTIRLDAQRDTQDGSDWLSFSVTDTGIGMSPEQIDRVFEAFSQADASTTREYGGTGLGLSITRQFSEMLGGSIDVRSAPGKGSCFTVRLPARAPEPEAQEQAGPARAGAVSAEAGAPGRTVLVIDDDASARDLIARFLRREGLGVIEATGGEEGLRLARQHHPAVITLDVVMPGMDGWTVLGRLQEDPELADTPVILLTMTDDRNLGYALGASEFLTKPIDWQRLGSVLRRYAGDEASPTALVVDDDPNARDMLRRGLEKAGWSVLEAENGRAGLTRLARSAPPPRLILLDLMMPEMDGFEFLDEFRKNAAWRAIPVLVVTAKELTPEDRSRLNGGVARILEKGSLTPRQLLEEVKGLVGAHVVARRGV